MFRGEIPAMLNTTAGWCSALEELLLSNSHNHNRQQKTQQSTCGVAMASALVALDDWLCCGISSSISLTVALVVVLTIMATIGGKRKHHSLAWGLWLHVLPWHCMSCHDIVSCIAHPPMVLCIVPGHYALCHTFLHSMQWGLFFVVKKGLVFVAEKTINRCDWKRIAAMKDGFLEVMKNNNQQPMWPNKNGCNEGWHLEWQCVHIAYQWQ